jgi:hypothetical protein
VPNEPSPPPQAASIVAATAASIQGNERVCMVFPRLSFSTHFPGDYTWLSLLMIARACHPHTSAVTSAKKMKKSPGAGRARADSVSGYSG